MKATALLATQHCTVLALLRGLESRPLPKGSLLAALASELPAHLAIEKDIFYPAVGHIDPDLVSDGIEEHALVTIAFEHLLVIDTDDPAFRGRVQAIRHILERHFEEEEDRLFPAVEHALEPCELEDLGDLMAERHHQLLGTSLVLPGREPVARDTAAAPC